MDRDPEVYDHDRLYSLNGGLDWCKNCIVDLVLMKGTDMLEKWIQDVPEGVTSQKAAQYADVLLADFVRHGVLDGFREVEAPMRAAYMLLEEAYKKREDARLATEEAALAWEVPAEDFRTRLKVLGNWAASTAQARARQFWQVEPSSFAYTEVVAASSWLKTPRDFVKYHDSFLRGINLIREMSNYDVIEGRLEQPVGMSDFESSLKVFKAAQARAEACQNEEAEAVAVFDSVELEYREVRHKAIAVLRPLSVAGQWALFRLFSSCKEAPEAG